MAVAMSGGVDSSVCALCLHEQGYQVTGVFWTGMCSGAGQDEAWADVQMVGKKLGIVVEKLDIGEQKSKLVDYMISYYQDGLTPNVCSWCNRWVKFGFFYNWALERGFDKIATGHYARVKINQDGQAYLYTAVDKKKDQTYFMALAEVDWLRVLLPLGEWHKSQVRDKARAGGLPMADKPESMEVCFMHGLGLGEFLDDFVEEKPGEIVVETEDRIRVVGQHSGLSRYTIGQRQGLQIQPESNQTPVYYVKAKDRVFNRLIVGVKDDLATYTLKVTLVGDKMALMVRERQNLVGWYVRWRHQGRLLPIKEIRAEKDGGCLVELKEAAWAVAPGQIAVFYQKDERMTDDYWCLGGGEIVE